MSINNLFYILSFFMLALLLLVLAKNPKLYISCRIISLYIQCTFRSTIKVLDAVYWYWIDGTRKCVAERYPSDITQIVIVLQEEAPFFIIWQGHTISHPLCPTTPQSLSYSLTLFLSIIFCVCKWGSIKKEGERLSP